MKKKLAGVALVLAAVSLMSIQPVEAGTACRYCVVWFQADISERGRDRASGHPDRCDYSGGYHIHRFIGRAFAENG